jgi:hypothetical protein
MIKCDFCGREYMTGISLPVTVTYDETKTTLEQGTNRETICTPCLGQEAYSADYKAKEGQ